MHRQSRASVRGGHSEFDSHLKPGTRISDEYVIGNRLGRGATAIVSECQNQVTGELFAVKTVYLRRLNAEDQRYLEQEIEVLKSVHHPNVVQYVATIQSRNFLHIIMQYMENGSLSANIHKFGAFPPNLVALYTKQVLEGLVYLHDQGVIHRDIKGDNILVDKTGKLKLADFGIAVMRGKGLEELGTGTPYWMAPEIIQMNPATPACDIWSVGCTVVEMLTTKAPYQEIGNPFTAIHRIVDQPEMPIPSGLPNEIVDFLQLCFRKDPSERPSARELLAHKWILSATQQPTTARSPGSGFSDDPSADGVPVMASRMSKTQLMTSMSSIGSQQLGGAVGNKQHRHSLPGQVYDSVIVGSGGGFESPPEGFELNGTTPGASSTFRHASSGRLDRVSNTQLRALGEEQELDDNLPPPVSISPVQTSRTDIVSPRSASNRKERLSPPPSSKAGRKVEIDLGKLVPSSEKDKGDEKAERLAKYKEVVDDKDFFDGVALPLRLAPSGAAGVDGGRFHLSKGDSVKNVMEALSAAEGSQSRQARTESVSASARALLTDLLQSAQKAPKAADHLVELLESNAEVRKALMNSQMGVFPLVDALASVSTPPLQQLAILRVLTEAASADRIALELLLVAGIVPTLTRLCGRRNSLEIRRNAARLVAQMLQTSPVTLHMFVACGGSDCLVALLEPVLPPSTSSATALDNGPQHGAAPLPPGPPIEIGLVALDGVQRLFAETLAPPGSQRRASFSRAAAEGLKGSAASAVTSATAVSKNDFCTLFSKTVLLDSLARLGERLQTDEGRDEAFRCNVAPRGALAEVCHVLTVFSRGSPQAKVYLARSSHAMRLALTTLATRWSAALKSRAEDEVDDDDLDTVRTLLECLRNLASDPACLDMLDAAGAIPALVPFLAVRQELLRERGHKVGGVVHAAANEVHNIAMIVLFYLVRLSPARQEKAAACGLAGLTLQAALDRTAVKSFAIQMLIEMSSASEFARHCLYREGAIEYMLDLMVGGDIMWQDKALQGLAQFLVSPVTQGNKSGGGASKSQVHNEIERHLLRPSALCKFTSLFQSAKSEQFERVAKVLVQIMEGSAKFAEAIGTSGVLVAEVCARLSYPKADVRIDLLRMLSLIAGRHTDLEALLLDHNLYAIIASAHQVAKQNKLVVVASHAEQLLASWRPVLDRVSNA